MGDNLNLDGKNDQQKLMRNVILWGCGVLACGTAGAAIGSMFVGPIDNSSPATFVGFIAGAAAFTCARLWLSEGSPKTPN